MTERVTDVVVVGRDAAVWMAAAAIQHSLGRTGVKVRVLELPPILRSVDVYSTPPSIAGFHRQIGIDHAALASVAKATPVVAQRYSNWAGAAPPFMLGYDDPPPPGSDIGFVHYWVKGLQNGLRVDLQDFSLGVAAARAGKVPVAAAEDRLTASYGLNFDAYLYAALLKQYAEQLGVTNQRAVIESVETDEGKIGAVVLVGGERVTAQFFVDASGAEGVLIGALPEGEVESWAGQMPCDRSVVASADAISPPPAFTQISAFRDGWVGLYPLQDRTAIVAAFSSESISDEAMVDSLSLLARLQIKGDAFVSRLRLGVRRRSWIGNCAAVGESAVGLDPLGSFGLHVTHLCLSPLLALFPAEAGVCPEAGSYNRAIGKAAENLRDLQFAHYKLNRRFDEPIWDSARETTAGGNLQRKMDIFSLRAQVPMYDEESVEEHHWANLFVGAGLLPQGYDRRVDAVPEESLIGAVQQRLREIAISVEQMPDVTQSMQQGRQPVAANV